MMSEKRLEDSLINCTQKIQGSIYKMEQLAKCPSLLHPQVMEEKAQQITSSITADETENARNSIRMCEEYIRILKEEDRRRKLMSELQSLRNAKELHESTKSAIQKGRKQLYENVYNSNVGIFSSLNLSAIEGSSNSGLQQVN